MRGTCERFNRIWYKNFCRESWAWMVRWGRPQRRTKKRLGKMRFSITTPVLNGVRYIDETVLSVISQAGDFSIRYHVQDGGSGDGTLEKLAQWAAVLGNGFPSLCRELEFSFSSARDQGVYDAVNRGFEACGPSGAMTWINASDRLEPGALAAASDIFGTFHDVAWITGLPRVFDERGVAVATMPLRVYPRAAILAGIYDGRLYQYIQQEGTIWRAGLWEDSGGLDTAFRLAGDFDLWRRFARFADLVSVEAGIGVFRRNKGQLSGDGEAYWAELDASLNEEDRAARRAIASKLRGASKKNMEKAGLAARVLSPRVNSPWVMRYSLPLQKRRGIFPRLTRSLSKRMAGAYGIPAGADGLSAVAKDTK